MRLSRSVWLAIAVAAGVTAWMISGLASKPANLDEPAPTRVAATRVTVETSRARRITREVTVSARTEPNRTLELRAETAGRVVAIGAQRGAIVAAGDRIVQLDLRDREARLEEARALVTHAELQSAAAEKLQREQFVSETQMAELASRVAGARAALQEVELEIANTVLSAPFDAVLQEREVEIGHYVNSGDTVAKLVDIDPLIVVGEVSEREIHELGVGKPGTARLVSGEVVRGTLRYLAPVAAESTRTFRVELAIPNREGKLHAGTTAELRLNAEEIEAHVISPSLLTLDDGGTVGVKAVNERDQVVFYAVEIAGSSDEGITVTGLPEQVRLITIGQGFVRNGDTVDSTDSPPFGALSDARGGAGERTAQRPL